MAVDTYALTTVARARQFLSGQMESPSQLAFTVYHNGTGVTSATVTVDDENLTLTTNLGSNVFDLDHASYDTLTELVVVINGVANWVAVLKGEGDMESQDLIPITATDALLAVNTQYLYINSDWMLEQLVNAVSVEVESYCERQFLSRDYTEYLEGGSDTLSLAQFPVTALTSLYIGSLEIVQINFEDTTASRAFVSIDDTNLTLTSVASGVKSEDILPLADSVTLALLKVAVEAISGWTMDINQGNTPDYSTFASVDLRPVFLVDCLNTVTGWFSIWEEFVQIKSWNSAIGIIRLSSPLPSGEQKVRAKYTAGYTMVPKDLELIVLDIIKLAWNTLSKDEGLKKERLADYSCTAKDIIHNDFMRQRLGLYLSPGFFS